MRYRDKEDKHNQPTKPGHPEWHPERPEKGRPERPEKERPHGRLNDPRPNRIEQHEQRERGRRSF